MRTFACLCFVLSFALPCFADNLEELIVRAGFPTNSTTAAPANQAFKRLVTVQEIERWKEALVSHLFNSDVRNILSGTEGDNFLSKITEGYKNNENLNGKPVFLSKLTDFANDHGLSMRLGLLDFVSLKTLKSENHITGPYLVDFIVPREGFKQALKEIFFSAGYINGLEDLFAIVSGRERSPTKRVVLNVLLKKVAGDLPKASAFLETATLAALEEKPELEFLNRSVEKLLVDHLESWAKLFCVVTAE